MHIYDSSQIAGWTNQYIRSVVAVQHWIGRRVERGLKTFQIWGQLEDFSRLPFAHVESRKNVIETLRKELPISKNCFRIMGLSGLGKTRTVYESLVDDELLQNLVVYIDGNQTPDVTALVTDWVTLNYRAILIVDNCEFKLHEHLVQQVRREGSQISLLSMDYNFDLIPEPTISFRLDPMSDDEVLQLLKPIYEDIPDLDRIVSFAQGFPQMAVLLAEARLTEDPRIGELNSEHLTQKLLWRHNEPENNNYLKILQACSLFDVFGIEGDVADQLQYISTLININIDDVYGCVQRYSDRGIIDRRGRYGQVVPKPLAIRLAGQWWTNVREEIQKSLIEGLPDTMVQGFCRQIEKMDFHPDVKMLTENLCGTQGPFGQAEVILSKRGSSLFRAFISVNPEATSSALFRVLSTLDHEQLLSITDMTRRNLVWGLEKLCFHKELFVESAWSMFLLASAENETYGNNATGMFAQLFRVNLSGTEADPDTRFIVLQQAIDMEPHNSDMVVLEALNQAVMLYGGSRTIGAEYQGSGAPLKEWRPTIWKEVFEHWQKAFDMLIVMLGRGELQKSKVLDIIGHSIRGFVRRGRIDMLDGAIKKVIELNGRKWPAAVESIKHTFQFDAEGLPDEANDALNGWLNLLNPEGSELTERLDIIVSSAPGEHVKGEDGHFKDIAAERSKSLATEVSEDVSSFLPLVNHLLEGTQNHSFVFGQQLVLDLTESKELIETTLELLKITPPTNINFVRGLFSGLSQKSTEVWQLWIDKLLTDDSLVKYYPDLILTGEIKKCHLDSLLEIIRSNEVSERSANGLSYGSVTDGIDSKTIVDFCLDLSSLGEDGAWIALHIIFMYLHGNEERIEAIRDPIKTLVTNVSLHKNQSEVLMDIYHWHGLAKLILKTPDQEFSIKLAEQLISASKHGFNVGDVLHYAKPLLTDLMSDYPVAIWPIFGDAIQHAEGMSLFWLEQLLERENSFSNQAPSVLSVLPPEVVVDWCSNNRDRGPAFVSGCLNVLESKDGITKPSDLFIAILENFGDDERVASSLSSNMYSRGYSGSLVPYLESDKEALTPLLEHDNSNVRRWIKDQIAYIEQQIEYESSRDDEHRLGIF